MNFDLKTPSSGSGKVGEGVGEGKVNNYFVMLGELCFFFNSFVMFYDSATKWVRNSYEYSRDSSGFGLSAEFTTMYNNPINKLKNRSRIS